MQLPNNRFEKKEEIIVVAEAEAEPSVSTAEAVKVAKTPRQFWEKE